jgi:TRAP-type C4-dicarboxylate transport system permease small subunit
MKRYGPLEVALGLLMATLAAVVFLQVVLRYVTYQPLAWTEEIARLLFLWACIIGAVIAARRGSHFAVDFFSRSLPGRVGRLFRASALIVEAAFYAVLAWGGMEVTLIAHGQRSVALDYRLSIAYGIIPLGAVCMCVLTVLRAGRNGRANPPRS